MGFRNNKDISFAGNEMGSVPWLLNRMGYEFDFCDITLEGVDLGKYPVIVYDSRNLPVGMFEKLQKWLALNEGFSKRLITYGALPTRKISDPRWDAGEPSGIKSNGLKIVDPSAGLPLGIKKISPGGDALLPIKRARTNADGLNVDLDQLKSALAATTPTYISEGLFPELLSGSQAVLSSLPTGSSNKLLYLNYDFGRPRNYGFDAPILEAILNDSGVESVFYAKPNENLSVHSYGIDGEPEARIIIVKNRSRIEREVASNVTVGNKMAFLLGPDQGHAATVSLKRWIQGKLVAFSFNRNETWDISEKSNAIALDLQDQMSDVFIVEAAESNSKWLNRLRNTRKRLNEFMGNGIDRVLLEKYAR